MMGSAGCQTPAMMGLVGCHTPGMMGFSWMPDAWHDGVSWMPHACHDGVSWMPDAWYDWVRGIGWVNLAGVKAKGLGESVFLCLLCQTPGMMGSVGCQTPGMMRSVLGPVWPGVSTLRPGETASLICSFCLCVAVCKLVKADPSLRYT